MTTTQIVEPPSYISKGEWDLPPNQEERIREWISVRLKEAKQVRKNFFKSMNMGCFE